MADPAGSSGERGIGAWPGIRQLREGPRLIGVLILAVLFVCGLTLWARFDRVVETPASGEFWRWVALLVLFGAPTLVLWFGRRRPPQPLAGRSQWSLVRARFLRSPQGMIGFSAVVFFYVIAFIAPFLAPVEPDWIPEASGQLKLMPPLSEGYILGSDAYARDILSRILHGGRVSLLIGVLAVSLSATIGFSLGLVAGYFGGLVDGLLMRFVDFMLIIPRLVLLLVIMALFKETVLFREYRYQMIVVILGVTGWMGTSRIVRGEVLSVKERDFVQAGRALGLGRLRLMLRHVAPNCLAPVIVSATLGIGGAILVEASLSFLGLGVVDPDVAWGMMVSDGKQYVTRAWWLTTLPGFAIVFAVTSFNLLGDGLRDAMDPRLKDVGRAAATEPDSEGEIDAPDAVSSAPVKG